MTQHINPVTDTTINKCCHHDTCYKINIGEKCINDPPENPIPCIFDTRKSINFTKCATHTPAHPPEAQQRVDAEQEVIKAAMTWWMMKRPLDYSEEQHMNNPKINCVTSQEDVLAEAIALLQAGRK